MKQTSLRGIANRAASDKAHRFQNLFGLLNVGILEAGALITVMQHYRDRADCENNFDEAKNHGGLDLQLVEPVCSLGDSRQAP